MSYVYIFFKLRRLTDIDSVYVDETGRLGERQIGKLYQGLNIRPEEGTAMLVRPDAVVAMVTAMHPSNVDSIRRYFENL